MSGGRIEDLSATTTLVKINRHDGVEISPNFAKIRSNRGR